MMRRGCGSEAIMSTFGEDLLYVNVGFAEKMRRELESETNPVSAMLNDANVVETLEQQVERIGGSHDTVLRLQSLYHVSQNSDVQYPITRLFSQQDYGL